MKKIIYSLAIAASALTFNSCVGDLDTLPLNETDKTAQQAYQTLEDFEKGLAYIYGSYSLVSQNDAGSSDIAVEDAGQSELTRQYVVLNEMSADALKCAWGDSYITDTQNATWSSTPNAATIAVYTRCMVAITRANEFLIQSGASSLEGVAGLRAEARFLRAYAYYMLLDLYGNPPFATEANIGGDLPKQFDTDFEKGRKGLFEWLEAELKDLLSSEDMPGVGEVSYPRVTKGAAQALLARMYLNAEVYTGEARWADAMTAAEATINLGYSLCPNYEELFMQDNGENTDSRNELIFAIAYDRDKTQSWGGTTHLVSGSLDDANSEAIAAALGYPEGSMIARERWNGYHVPTTFVADNFELSDVEWGGDGLGYNRATSDKRAFFSNVGCSETFDISTIESGWRCWKFTSRDSEGNLYSSDSYDKFSSIDFPMIRLAEMYLIYAEAKARIDGGITTDAKVLGYVKALRDRAGLSTPSSVDTEFILKERACELMWEGHRRTDLIRYGYFTSMSYPWPNKGGVPDGKAAIADYRIVYPILNTDLTENPNLVQNPGY
ncbi:MAG: RagB/SusD family nutrient uptake outer membrane protein [Bacteroides sp.]|nr:RagB/SusD family nutrient uptake outer membrane protein [Bacteroides sp.]